MKSVVISFRVSPKTLAKVLDGLWRQNPCFEPSGLSKIGKKTFEQGGNYLIQGLDYEPSPRAKETLTKLSKRIEWEDKKEIETEQNQVKTKEQLFAEATKRDEEAFFAKKRAEEGEII